MGKIIIEEKKDPQLIMAGLQLIEHAVRFRWPQCHSRADTRVNFFLIVNYGLVWKEEIIFWLFTMCLGSDHELFHEWVSSSSKSFPLLFGRGNCPV